VARVLIVGCGCRGQRLASALIAEGHAVRGTTRREARVADISAAGAEGVIADPDRLATLMPHLAGVSVACWLMGTAESDAAAALHGPRLASLVEKLVDTHVRGLVYEAAADAALLAEGAATVRRAAQTWRMPVEVVGQDPGEHEEWLAAMTAAVGRVLSG
jgi:uncharacterized protein YbjT (DUF2867 family)